MKILITTDLYTTNTNGVVTSLKNLAYELIKKGHDVKILTFADKHSGSRNGNVYYIRSLPMDIIYPNVRIPASYGNKIVKELMEWHPDIIHSQCEFFSYRFAKRIAKKTGAPIVHTYHTLYEQYVTYIFPSRRIGKHIVSMASRHILKNADVIIAPTSKVETALRGYGLKNKICVIPSGIDLSCHKNRLSESLRTQKRLALGIENGKKVLINLGRLGNEKNLSELLYYFKDAKLHHPELVFLIVGDGPAKKELEKTASELNISDNVIFTGMVSPGDVTQYYQLADIFVSASTSETQGLTYIEASANGLPLLCRRDPCLSDVLINGKNGIDYETENEFQNALEKMLSNSEWMKAAEQKSREIANHFEKSLFGNRVEALYADVLEKLLSGVVIL